MGYAIYCRASQFRIYSANQAPALASIKALARTEQHIAWVDNATILRARHIEDALSEFGWPVEFDDADNIVSITFDREKIGDEDKLFGVLAPFVEPGSYIEAQGEDGERWRWVFDGQTCREVHAQIVWPTA